MELSNKSLNFYDRYLYQGEVIDNQSNNDSGVIKVRITEIDQNIGNDDLSPCYPTSNFQMLRILPKVGERVFVFMDRVMPNTDARNNQNKRYWMGISIPSVTNINYSPFYFNSNSHETDGWINNNRELKNIKFSEELSPSDEDILIRGRDNTEIALKGSEILIRAGRHIKNIPPLYNSNNPSFIQILHEKNLNDNQQEEVLIETPAIIKYRIILTVVNTSMLMKVINVNTKEILETVSENYPNENILKQKTLAKLAILKEKYKEWSFVDKNNIFPLEKTKYVSNNNLIRTRSNKIQSSDELYTSVNVVSERINLLSHKTYSDLAINKDYLNQDNLGDINDNTQPLVKGNDLKELLSLIILFMNNHTHPYPNMKPVNDILLEKINSFDLNKILHDFIRIG